MRGASLTKLKVVFHLRRIRQDPSRHDLQIWTLQPWRIPVGKWLVAPIYGPFRPFGRGITPFRDLLTMVINHLQNGMILQVGSRVVPTILRGRSNDQPTVKPLMPWHCSTDERIVATKIRFQGYILGAKSRGQSYANPNPPTNKTAPKKTKPTKK